MKLIRLYYKNTRTGWSLSSAGFNDFNLLVGASGAGKTSILRCLQRIRATATESEGRAISLNGDEWELSFNIDGAEYLWSLHSAQLPQIPEEINLRREQRRVPNSVITHERLVKDGISVFERSPERIIFQEAEVPAVNGSGSLLTIFQAMLPIQEAFRRLIFSSSERGWFLERVSEKRMRAFRARYHSLEELRADSDLSLLLKVYLLQELFPDQFGAIVSQLRDIFEFVEDVRVQPLPPDQAPFFSDDELILFALKERGVENWVYQIEFSSGMLRTLEHLFELTLALPGSVFIVDEFENSLGVNCMDAVAHMLLDRQGDLQFILTSHHPYIINAFPMHTWQLVQRNGSIVHMTPASQIPELSARSHVDGFTRLMNLPQYQGA